MSKSGIVYDVDQLMEKLDDIHPSRRPKLFQSAILFALTPTHRLVKRYADETINNKGNSKLTPYAKNRVKKYAHKSGIFGAVTIMTKPDPRLNWFSYGTVQRKTKKGKSCGKIVGNNFFSRAISESESNINKRLETSLSKKIFKEWEKR